MPLTAKGSEIMANFKKEYGEEQGERYFYAAKNAGTITGVDAMEEKPEEDCGDQPMTTTMPVPPTPDETPVTTPVPKLETEHPQLHPDGSSPPEPALGGDEANFGMRDATGAGWGGIAGGVIPQDWGGDAAPLIADMLPSGGMSLADICRAGRGFWGQWGE
jgi:hypothetical protein